MASGGAVCILPIQVNMEETKTQQQKMKIDVEILFVLSYKTWNQKNRNDNCNFVFQSNGKTENENTSWNSIFNVVGKRKTEIESWIPFSDGVGKRRTQLQVWIPFSHVVGKRLALRYTHYKCYWSSWFQVTQTKLALVYIFQTVFCILHSIINFKSLCQNVNDSNIIVMLMLWSTFKSECNLAKLRF